MEFKGHKDRIFTTITAAILVGTLMACSGDVVQKINKTSEIPELVEPRLTEIVIRKFENGNEDSYKYIKADGSEGIVPAERRDVDQLENCFGFVMGQLMSEIGQPSEGFYFIHDGEAFFKFIMESYKFGDVFTYNEAKDHQFSRGEIIFLFNSVHYKKSVPMHVFIARGDGTFDHNPGGDHRGLAVTFDQIVSRDPSYSDENARYVGFKPFAKFQIIDESR